MPRPPVRRERLVVGRIDVQPAEHDEEPQHEQLDDHHDVVRARALADADVEQPGDRQHDERGGNVQQDGNAGDPRRRLQQPVDRRDRAEERRAIAVCQAVGQRNPEPGEQRREIAAPGDRDRDVADRVFENQVPADDPRDELAQRRVRVGVGAAGLRDHRGQLGVAQRREPADDAEQDEREDQRRAGAVADDFAARESLAGGRGADRREDAGADDGANREHDQIAGAQSTRFSVFGLSGINSEMGLRRNS